MKHCNNNHFTFTSEADGERILKIDQQWARVGCLIFGLTSVLCQ